MQILYSKQTGKITNVIIGTRYNSIQEMCRDDWQDKEITHAFLEVEDDWDVARFQDFIKVKDDKLIYDDAHLDFLKGKFKE